MNATGVPVIRIIQITVAVIPLSLLLLSLTVCAPVVGHSLPLVQSLLENLILFTDSCKPSGSPSVAVVGTPMPFADSSKNSTILSVVVGTQMLYADSGNLS